MPRPAPVRRRRPRDERGVVAVMVALLMSLVLLAASAFVLDIGAQRVARSDMQALADVVALDLSRQLDGRSAAALVSAGLQTWADQSRDRNLDNLGARPRVAPQLGQLDSQGRFVRVSGSAVPTAVRVEATTDVDFVLGGFTDVDRGSATRSAIAASSAGACLRVGSYLASVDSTQSALLNPLLSGLLGSSVGLTAVGYNGLAGSDVTLAELVRVGGLTAGTADDLLALRNVSLADFYLASAKVLDAQGKRSEANVLRALQVGTGTPRIALGDLISAAPGDASALTAKFNVLQLVQGAALLANKGRAVSIPGLTANVGIGTTTATLQVIEAPQTRCGPVGIAASTAQVRLDLTTHLNAQKVAVPALNTSVDLDPLDVNVSVDLGKAIATLTAVTCASGAATSLSVALRSAVVGSISVSATSRVRATIGVPLTGGGSVLGGLLTTILSRLGLGGLLSPPSLIIDNAVALSGGSPGTAFSRDLTLPIPGAYTVPVGSGSGVVIGNVGVTSAPSSTLILRYRPLLSSTTRDLTILSTEALFTQALSPILDQVLAGVVNPLVASVQTNVVAPLARLLGTQVAGADVFAVPTPTCSSPVLRQ